MMKAESQGARRAIATGVYIVWRSQTGADCARVGSDSRCFCGHSLLEHKAVSKSNPQPPACSSCSCRRFNFVPSRPEECGMWWLPRRKGFDVHAWRAPCRCKHGHDAHDPVTGRCRACACPSFVSAYCCVGCDAPQEEHETVFELEAERVAAGRPVGAAFAPLHGCSAELRREAGLGGASSAGALSLEEQVASGAITPARYHELLQAEGPAGGALVAAAVAPRERRPHAPVTVSQCQLDMGGGQRVTVTTNFGPPDPGDGRRDWSREWEPASGAPQRRGVGGRGAAPPARPRGAGR